MVELGVPMSVAEARAAPLALDSLASVSPGYAVVNSAAATRLISEWAALADGAAADNLFFHPDFALPAMSTFGSAVAVATVRKANGTLTAAAPFARSRLGHVAPAIRLWSHKYGPLGTPLIGSADVGGMASALIEGLAPRGSGLSLIVPDLPLDEPVAAVLVAHALRDGRPVDVLGRHVRAILDRPATGALDLRATLPARRRKELGRQMRRLGDLGAVTFETASDPHTISAAFDAFLMLEDAGWKGRDRTALLSSPTTADFARQVVANRASSGAARVDLITLEGRPIAAVVSFVAGKTAFTWKIAYDEAYARFSPGAQLMLEVAPRIFAETHVARIDSCADANHPMIDRLWGERMELGTLVIGPPGGRLLHRLGLIAARVEISARALVRRLRR